ncbi:hypothetical protein QR680_007899 [Steinernema hermaphroditum]|uniref:Uncharacterized protein n=1 Tax=Steinernema hermaphroditum TaxID=289476 RepID=A0AA39IGT0_9BILA|nr:hypothetical protein QR680_007899 [Steinernema hermaphroditum]
MSAYNEKDIPKKTEEIPEKKEIRSAVSNNLELLSFLNEYDEKFGNHFDYELSRWFASQIKITSNAEKSQELLGLLDDHDAEMESIAGITSEQLDDFREKQSYAFLSTAVLNNATEDEVGKLVEIYMRTMTFIRARKLQNFTASFLVQPWKTRLSDFEDILISADRRVLDAINSLDMLDNLKSLAKEFWKSYSSAHTPGIKESCLVYRSNSETLDYDEILDRIRVAIMMQVTSCIPPGEQYPRSTARIDRAVTIFCILIPGPLFLLLAIFLVLVCFTLAIFVLLSTLLCLSLCIGKLSKTEGWRDKIKDYIS